MKIIAKDNLNRETVSDTLVCENIHHGYGVSIVDLWNNEMCKSTDKFFVLVKDDYKLYDSSVIY